MSQDAFWLLGEIKRQGAKLESTLERIDDSPQGLLLYAVMAGVNAFRFRGDVRSTQTALSQQRPQVLRNDYYIGVVAVGGRENHNGRHPALIDEATFTKVQEPLDTHARSGDRSQKHEHDLKGTIFCARRANG